MGRIPSRIDILPFAQAPKSRLIEARTRKTNLARNFVNRCCWRLRNWFLIFNKILGGNWRKVLSLAKLSSFATGKSLEIVVTEAMNASQHDFSAQMLKSFENEINSNLANFYCAKVMLREKLERTILWKLWLSL